MQKETLSQLRSIFQRYYYESWIMGVYGLKEKTIDVTSLGELLIDMTPHGISPQGNALLEVNPGGAPCNVLAMVSKLGGKTAFIGKVGEDQFGRLLEEALNEQSILTDGLVKDIRYATTLAFVHLDQKGDRSFSFCRKPGADMMLEKQDVCEELIAQAKVFHFGTLSMTNEPSLSATKHAVDLAKKHQCLISFDPNIRPPLWDSLDNAKIQMAYGLGQCDILKISDNEIQLFTGLTDLDKAAEKLITDYPNIRLMFLTLGRNGSRYYYGKATRTLETFLDVETIDTTGAGDTFTGCCLYFITQYGLDALDEEKLSHMVRFANGAASLITTKKGALKVMPQRKDIEALIDG